MIKSAKQLVAEANAIIETVSVAQAIQQISDPNIVFVDLRESHELTEDGVIPGAVHVPRGTLEWVADPDSSRHNPVFASGKKLLLYCAGGGRSALAAHTLHMMGFTRVAHLDGGIKAWIAARGPLTVAP